MSLYDRMIKRPFVTALLFVPASTFGMFLTIISFFKDNIPAPYDDKIIIAIASLAVSSLMSFLSILFTGHYRKSELYFNILEYIPHPIVITSNKNGNKFTTKNKVVYTNRHWLDHYNFTRKGVLNKSIDYIREHKPKVIPVDNETQESLKKD